MMKAQKKTRLQKETKSRRLTRGQWFFMCGFGLPPFLLFSYFTIIPMLQSVKNSFYMWDGYSDKIWNGLNNYINIFKDSVFHESVINDLTILFFKELIIVVLAITFAVSLTRLRFKKSETNLLRFVFYIPTILSIVIISMVWKFFFNMGLFDDLMKMLGLNISAQNGWITDHPIPIVTFVASWCGIGAFMIILIAAINNIPAELYEAADMDGAGQLRQLFMVTLPTVTPQVRYMVVGIVTSIIASNMNLIKLFTNGGPGTKSYVMGLYVFNYAYDKYEVGYSNAASVLLMIITVSVTGLINHFIAKREIY